jgi:Fe(3+) dicitrate transport protein
MKQILITLSFLLLTTSLLSAGTITGTVKNKQSGDRIEGVLIYSGKNSTRSDVGGNFKLPDLSIGSHKIFFVLIGYFKDSTVVEIQNPSDQIELNEIFLTPANLAKDTVVIRAAHYHIAADKLKDVDGTVINAGKKTDVVIVGETGANTALSNQRQLFARVPGITVWENDATGTGINIATRGLSPNRSWEFNMRQNGYDISSDPIGYPETYFSPAMEGVERIDIVRGAASLQYGTQFGGMVNYRMKSGSKDTCISGELSLSGGSYGCFNSFTSIGGTAGKFSYYGFYNFRRADGWRNNSSYINNNGYVHSSWAISKKLKAEFEFTGVYYLLRQPGGITDSAFQADPRASFRNRNWFEVRWNMPAVSFTYENGKNLISVLKLVMIDGERNSVGYTGAANTPDNLGDRTVDRDYYTNLGAEWRTAWQYNLLGERKSVLSFGVRYYKGNTLRKQGKGTAGSDAQFTFNDPANLSRNLNLNSTNTAVFFENLFCIGKNLSVSPGIRYELIRSSAEGKPAVQTEKRNYSLPLLGIAAQYKLPFSMIGYANWSQSFRPVTFNELWTNNANLTVDQNLKAVTGWSSDFGLRGNIREGLYYDISAFYMVVEGRISDITAIDENGNNYLLRTNAGNSLNHGIEAYLDLHPFQLGGHSSKIGDLSIFSSVSYLEAYYTVGPNEGKRVEYAPRWTIRNGFSWQYKIISTTLAWTYVDGVYTDSRNTVFSAAATSGKINSYHVLDGSLAIQLPKQFSVKLSANNITNNRYFTRRASGYPGPGIIPSEARTFTLTALMKF